MLLNRVLGLDPANKLAALSLATTALRKGDAKVTLVYAAQVLHWHPKSVSAYNLQGPAHISLGDVDSGRLALPYRDVG